MREIVPQYRALGQDGRFAWFGLVPDEVWLEALVNAVIHRAYSNFGDHIRLVVFDDRIEIESPGRFPGLSSPKDLTKVRRYARNPRIARVMAELDYGQELGEGLRRMVDAMESRGQARPLLTETPGGVSIALHGALDIPDELSVLPQIARSNLRPGSSALVRCKPGDCQPRRCLTTYSSTSSGRSGFTQAHCSCRVESQGSHCLLESHRTVTLHSQVWRSSS